MVLRLLIPGRIGILKERGNLEYPEKTSRIKGENQQQTQRPHMASTQGFEPGPHWWEASALTTAPPLRLENSRWVSLTDSKKPVW